MGIPRLIAKLGSLKTDSSSNFDEDKNTDWQLYDCWLKKHPSALDTFQEMMCAAEGKTVIVFLDYDGTLSPIVNDPDVAFMTEKMRTVVNDVGSCFPTSIISGRSRDKVYDFVKLDNIYYAGSHGMDIMAPLQPLTIRNFKYQAKAADRKIQSSLKERTGAIEGVKVEDNKFCMSVHYRNVLDEDLGTLEQKVNSVLNEHPHFRLTRGKKVLEIRPAVDWDKGHALEYMIDSLGLTGSNDVLPIYIGDDTSDEDALYDTTEVMLFLYDTLAPMMFFLYTGISFLVRYNRSHAILTTSS